MKDLLDTRSKEDEGIDADDFWEEIANSRGNHEFDYLEDDDLYKEYGPDFSGDQNMCLLFAQESTYFHAIAVGENYDIDKLDEYPIYLIDLSENEGYYVGNFRTFVEDEILNEYLKFYGDGAIHIETINLMKDKLKNFSTNVIKRDKYIIKNDNIH